MSRTYLEYIEKEFIKIDSEIAIKNSRGYFDINKIVEDTFMHILNVTYNWNLKNANLIEENFPSVDLIDDKKKIVIQVTSTTNTTKVNNTVKKFKELTEYPEYTLKMFYIKHQPNFSTKMLDKFELEGIQKNDLLDISTILDEVSADTSKAVRLYTKLQEIVIEDKIIEPPLSSDVNHYITIELVSIDGDNFNIVIWGKSEKEDDSETKFAYDESYTRNEIVQKIDKFISEKYKSVPSKRIFLVFVLPSQLMKEDINFWKLEDGKLLGKKYGILLRGKERFRKDRRSEKFYRYKDWEENWNVIKKEKCDECISEIKCIINKEDKEDIDSQEVSDTPLVIMKYEPTEKSFIRLYKSAIPLVMWANNCEDFTEFEKIFDKETHKSIKLHKLKESLFKFRERHTKLPANIMLMYDNPNKLAPDAESTRYNIPE